MLHFILNKLAKIAKKKRDSRAESVIEQHYYFLLLASNNVNLSEKSMEKDFDATTENRYREYDNKNCILNNYVKFVA